MKTNNNPIAASARAVRRRQITVLAGALITAMTSTVLMACQRYPHVAQWLDAAREAVCFIEDRCDDTPPQRFGEGNDLR